MLIKNILPKRSTQDIIEKIADCFFVLFIVARQAFRYTPGFTSIWPIARYGMYGIVLLQIIKKHKIKKNGFLVWSALFLAIALQVLGSFLYVTRRNLCVIVLFAKKKNKFVFLGIFNIRSCDVLYPNVKF